MSLNTSFERIKREIGIKRCLILEGNIGDFFIEGLKIVTLEDKLNTILKNLEYEDVVFWDRIAGVKGKTDNLKLVDNIEVEGETYSLDDDDDDADNNTANAQDANLAQLKDPSQFFSVIEKNLSDNNKSTVFVLNWSDYVFGREGSLSPEDRENLTLLGKAIRTERPNYHFDKDSQLQESHIIIITNKVSLLPISMYQGNAEVSCIHIPKPDRNERKDLLLKLEDNFSLKFEQGETLLNSPKTNQCIDMLDDFSNKEIIQMAKLSCKIEQSEGTSLTFDKLFLLFKYGEKDNPWEKLDHNALKKIKETLGEQVVGQETAISRVEEVVIKAYMGLTGLHKTSSRTMPKGVLFFVGPTGVGKTELSKAIAKFLFGDEQACIRFDMSEYAQSNSDQKLIGAPPGYVGYEEGGQLTNAIRKKPFSIILFDEIEKAAKPNPRILDIFLQILEDGRLTDSKGETVNFSESIIIFTSNLGASEILNSNDKKDISNQFIKKVKDYFNNELERPELLGRIGYNNIVPFDFIDNIDFSKKIAISKLKPICDGIKEKYQMELGFEDVEEFITFVLNSSDTNKGGRDILNAINDILLDQLSMYLFENKNDLNDLKGSRIITKVDKVNKKLGFEFG